MAISVNHATTAVGTEAGDGEIGKDEWNANHSLSMATDRILGRTTAGTGTPEELSAGSGLTLASGSLDVAGYKYLGTMQNSGSLITGYDFRIWQQTYQRMKVVITTDYTSAMYYRVYIKDDSGGSVVSVNMNGSYMAWGNTGSYPRTVDYVNSASLLSHWYTYHYTPTFVFDLFSIDGTTIGDTVVSYPRLMGWSYGHTDYYPEQIYLAPNSTSQITSRGFEIWSSTSSATCTLHAWGM